jgi:pyrimidine-nucleoside phosphorylase
MSGRGLGFAQGTIDKLESIPGFRVNLQTDEFIRQVKQIGIAIMGQTENIALADKKLYALRDVTGTVESIPLIASSIMSKKLASGADKILLEVTCGSGAFMESEIRARKLAQTMVKIGELAEKETIAVITNMNQPLGRYCGNALETREAIVTLSGEGEPDVVEVCTVLGAYMLKLAGRGESIVENMRLIQSKIDSKEGLAKFREMVQKQWGDTLYVDEPDRIMTAKYKIAVEAREDGYVEEIEAKNIGQAVVNLGGGRLTKEDPVDYACGIEVVKKIGDAVKAGEPIMYIHANDEEKALSQVVFLRNSYKITNEKVDKLKAILDVVE